MSSAQILNAKPYRYQYANAHHHLLIGLEAA